LLLFGFPHIFHFRTTTRGQHRICTVFLLFYLRAFSVGCHSTRDFERGVLAPRVVPARASQERKREREKERER
jgi:hypothetical protein